METGNHEKDSNVQGHEMESESEDLPVVFQCQHCNSILSDSVAFVAANDDLKAITVNRVTQSVEVSSKLVTSASGVDCGSTFSPLTCLGCQTNVGKAYRTTPRILDDLRDFFTFDVKNISVYQVGSASVSCEGDDPPQCVTSLRTLKETVLKLQVLICTMHQRVANVEQALDIDSKEAADSPQNATPQLSDLTNTRKRPSSTHPTDQDGEDSDELEEEAINQNGRSGRGAKSHPQSMRGAQQYRRSEDDVESEDATGGNETNSRFESGSSRQNGGRKKLKQSR